MYKVFVNQRTIYLAGNIDQGSICVDAGPVECANRLQVESAFSEFLADSSKASLSLFSRRAGLSDGFIHFPFFVY